MKVIEVIEHNSKKNKCFCVIKTLLYLDMNYFRSFQHQVFHRLKKEHSKWFEPNYWCQGFHWIWINLLRRPPLIKMIPPSAPSHIALFSVFATSSLFWTPVWTQIDFPSSGSSSKPVEEMKCVSGYCLPRGYKKLETPSEGTWYMFIHKQWKE